MILIGSRALQLRAPVLLKREPRDFDFVATESDAAAWLDSHSRSMYREDGKFISSGEPPCEFDIITSGSSNELLGSLVSNDMRTSFGRVPDLDLLFTIKSSHKYRKSSPHFWKTLQDFHRMRNAGARIRSEYAEFHKMRQAETLNYSHPKLNQSKDAFFKNDGVKYVYDHDQVHDAIKFLDKPAYRYYMKDGSDVMSDKGKFFDQPVATRYYGVIEEACTLAIERSLVPFPGAMTPLDAWRFAFSKVCTSITSGWFREFAYLNAPAILKIGPGDYWDRFLKAKLCPIT